MPLGAINYSPKDNRDSKYRNITHLLYGSIRVEILKKNILILMIAFLGKRIKGLQDQIVGNSGRKLESPSPDLGA